MSIKVYGPNELIFLTSCFVSFPLNWDLNLCFPALKEACMIQLTPTVRVRAVELGWLAKSKEVYVRVRVVGLCHSSRIDLMVGWQTCVVLGDTRHLCCSRNLCYNINSYFVTFCESRGHIGQIVLSRGAACSDTIFLVKPTHCLSFLLIPRSGWHTQTVHECVIMWTLQPNSRSSPSILAHVSVNWQLHTPHPAMVNRYLSVVLFCFPSLLTHSHLICGPSIFYFILFF